MVVGKEWIREATLPLSCNSCKSILLQNVQKLKGDRYGT